MHIDQDDNNRGTAIANYVLRHSTDAMLERREIVEAGGNVTQAPSFGPHEKHADRYDDDVPVNRSP
jgi:hypothetical protein